MSRDLKISKTRLRLEGGMFYATTYQYPRLFSELSNRSIQKRKKERESIRVARSIKLVHYDRVHKKGRLRRWKGIKIEEAYEREPLQKLYLVGIVAYVCFHVAIPYKFVRFFEIWSLPFRTNNDMQHGIILHFRENIKRITSILLFLGTRIWRCSFIHLFRNLYEFAWIAVLNNLLERKTNDEF